VETLPKEVNNPIRKLSIQARNPWMIALVLIVIHIAILWFARPGGIETRSDDAEYLMLSRSLQQFEYKDSFLLDPAKHVKYPPGYPVLLLAWGKLLGTSFDNIILLNIISSAFCLGILFLILKSIWSPTLALLSLALLSINYQWVSFATQILAEAPYALLSLCALGLLAQKSPTPKILALAGFLAITAAFTRSVGVFLIFAVGVHLLLEKRFIPLAIFALFSVLTFGAWLGWTLDNPGGGVGQSYVKEAARVIDTQSPDSSIGGALLEQVFRNSIKTVGASIPGVLGSAPIKGTIIDNLIGGLVTSVCLGVGLISLTSRWRAAGIYLLCYGGLLQLYPWVIPRFWVPMLPFLVPTVLLGAQAVGRYVRPGSGKGAMIAIFLVLAASNATRTAGMLYMRSNCDRGGKYPDPTCLIGDGKENKKGFFQALRYIEEHLPGDAIILSSKPATLYHYTGRSSVSYHNLITPKTLSFPNYLQKLGVHYVLVSDLLYKDEKIATPLGKTCSGFILEKFFPPRTYLFRVSPENKTSEKATESCSAINDYQRNLDL
jgi:xanthosine utilization system XapX-like protein